MLCGGDEDAEFVGVFFAGRGFDAAGDVDAMRAGGEDGFATATNLNALEFLAENWHNGVGFLNINNRRIENSRTTYLNAVFELSSSTALLSRPIEANLLEAMHMELNCICPSCGFKLSDPVGPEGICPQCGLAIPKETIWTKLMSPWFVAKAGLGLTLGIIPGVVLHVLGHQAGINIIVFGGFIGLALAVAKVSVGGIASAGAAVAVSRVVPRPLQSAIINKIAREGSDEKADQNPTQSWP